MSFVRKLSLRSKARTEFEGRPLSVCVMKCVLSEELPSPTQGIGTTADSDIPPAAESYLVDGDKHNVQSTDIQTENTSGTVTFNDVDTQHDPVHSSLERPQSFSIPDGLVMDPLAPTALAVSTEFMERIGSGLTLLRDHGKKVQKYVWKSRKFDILKKSWKSIVNVVLIEAKDLQDDPTSGSSGLYCKFKLGSETYKSKQVSKTKATWRERFNLYLYDDSSLEIILWHKGKQKDFMGRCLIDLSQLEKEKTHDLWSELDCGQGSLHLLVTLSGSARSIPMDDVPTTNPVHHFAPPTDDYTWYRLDNDWTEVGRLSVTVHSARGLSALGLSGKADAYCVLELDNSRVQTHMVPCTNDPTWNKSYSFAVNDVTSTLDITVYDESIITSMKGETLGKISIPLLRIKNDEKRWYALKDRSKRSSAKGNYPRILLQMSMVWNPIKASLRVLSPKETKYTQKPTKFNIPLIYSNLKFIKDIFTAVHNGHELLKQAFEWEDREKSAIALTAWLIFWFFFRMWMTPLLLLAPFIGYWIAQRSKHDITSNPDFPTDEDLSDDDLDTNKDEKTIKNRLYGLQDLTFTIKNGIDYVVALLERLRNLANFTVPYLSYLAMATLVAASAVLYFIPINFIFMALGLYKFTRKYLNPDRVPNNDLLDFLSRVPDNRLVKDWQELKACEPNMSRSNSAKKR